MIYILWCEIDISKNFNSYFKKIPKPMQESILRCRRLEDQWAKIVGKLLLLEGMKLLSYKEIDLTELQYTIHNRPYVQGQVDFNISHSGSYVVCALSNQNTIGVDIEEIKDIDFEDFKYILSEKEWSVTRDADNSLQKFYSYWTAKESLLKADGRGIAVALDNVCINSTHGSFEDKQWFLQEIEFNPAYVLHIASDIPIEEIQIKEITINELS